MCAAAAAAIQPAAPAPRPLTPSRPTHSARAAAIQPAAPRSAPPHPTRPPTPHSSHAGASPSPAYARVFGNLARPSMFAGAAIGAAAGFMLAYQNSCGRLMGYRANEDDVTAQAAAQA